MDLDRLLNRALEEAVPAVTIRRPAPRPVPAAPSAQSAPPSAPPVTEAVEKPAAVAPAAPERAARRDSKLSGLFKALGASGPDLAPDAVALPEGVTPPEPVRYDPKESGSIAKEWARKKREGTLKMKTLPSSAFGEGDGDQ